MNLPRIVVLPSLVSDGETAELVDKLSELLPLQHVVGLGSIGSQLPLQTWIAAVSLGISRSGPAFDGVHLVAIGAAADRLPPIGFAQRAARRTVHSYICIDSLPAGQFVDWPDAPVVLIQASPLATVDAANLARLRGWEVVMQSDSARAVAEAVTSTNP